MFDTGVLFDDIINCNTKTLVLQGGTSSGKTYSSMQALFYFAISERHTITIVGESIPSLRKGCWRDAQGIIEDSEELKQYIDSINKTDRIIYFSNGSLMEFCSFENEKTARAGKRSILYVDEINNIEESIFFQLSIRTTDRVIVSYNPSEKFYIHDKYIGKPNVTLNISDHRHNPFIPSELHDEIEAIEDPELHKVYARGKTGTLHSHIYTNWVKIPDSHFPETDKFFFGIDWGHSVDPTAIVKCCMVGDSLFVKELSYTAGLAPLHVKQILQANGYDAATPVWADHDPEMISELRRLGVVALPARKGQGSILAGILALRQVKVFYTQSSINLSEELKRYVFLTDKKTGDITNCPIDKYNHLCDSIRYAFYSRKFNGK